MRQSDRFKLHFGPYRAPYVRRGRRIMCALRGEILTDGMTDARIPWPIGRGGRTRSIVLCGDLEKAVEKESFQAIMYWWNVSGATVSKWRRALKVPTVNKGTRLLRKAYANSPAGRAALRKAWAKARDPERCAKIAAKRGKKRPAAVVAAMRARMLGSRLSSATRRKMSAAHRRRGTRPPWLGPSWSAEEDEVIRTSPAVEATERTGRSLSAVYSRRSALGVNDGRTTRHRRSKSK